MDIKDNLQSRNLNNSRLLLVPLGHNLNKIKDELPDGVKLVVVSKTRTVDEIMEAYNSGHRIFGENRAQELILKYGELPKDIEWHMIGHLQTNKVKYIAPFISLVHSVDSLKLLQIIDKEAKKNCRIIDCLLQIRIAREETKQGLDIDGAEKILNSEEFKILKNIRVAGLMGMASRTEDKNTVRAEFNSLRKIFKKIKNNFFKDDPWFKEISMGMSGDYKIAIDKGSTIIRVGGKIFGSRD